MKQIVFHLGGPSFHPVEEQTAMIMDWLGNHYRYVVYDGIEAFERLDSCDLLVVMGLHWTGMNVDWAGNLDYQPMEERHQHAFEHYIASGRPVLAHHGAIASYDDWPRFGELLGFTWVWGTTTHSPFGEYHVQVLPTGHPIVAGVQDYTLPDELYYNVQITPGLHPTIHAVAEWEGEARPMALTAEGGRVPGAGRTVYLANGHDMRAFACPAMQKLWVNAVEWLFAST